MNVILFQKFHYFASSVWVRFYCSMKRLPENNFVGDFIFLGDFDNGILIHVSHCRLTFAWSELISFNFRSEHQFGWYLCQPKKFTSKHNKNILCFTWHWQVNISWPKFAYKPKWKWTLIRNFTVHAIWISSQASEWSGGGKTQTIFRFNWIEPTKKKNKIW